MTEVKNCHGFSLYSKKSRRSLKLLCLELDIRTAIELRNLGKTIRIFKEVIIKLKGSSTEGQLNDSRDERRLREDMIEINNFNYQFEHYKWGSAG